MKLRELKTRSTLLRHQKTGLRERHMARRRMTLRLRASIMKPVLMWARTAAGREGEGPRVISELFKATLRIHPHSHP